MKKLFSIALISVLALTLLAACNTPGGTAPATDAQTGKALITIVNNTGFEIAVTAIQLAGSGYITPPGDPFADHSIADGASKIFQIDAPADAKGTAMVGIKSRNSECRDVVFSGIPDVAAGATITLTAAYTINVNGMGEGVATAKNR
ncbi:MAG: hypothetical protein FWE98_03495 [Oscillospiraceae bacterium]|nr:hypothetical protein [Oscillospiraceae bacterium]